MRFFHIDSFAEAPFTGNPAGVCLLPGPRSDDWMQRVAFEMNLSETAFVLREEGAFRLRWFTPVTEVDLCGHATLAAAHALWESGELGGTEEARFHTRSGLLTVVRRGDAIWMDFPALAQRSVEAPQGLLAALGLDTVPDYVGVFGASEEEYLIEVGTEELIQWIRPDFSALRAFSAHALVVTSASASADYDFVSRCFAPWVGIDEDPVTGSTHCCLGPFWGAKLGKTVMRAYQASARGGTILVELRGDRVSLGGQARTVVSGELAV